MNLSLPILFLQARVSLQDAKIAGIGINTKIPPIFTENNKK